MERKEQEIHKPSPAPQRSSACHVYFPRPHRIVVAEYHVFARWLWWLLAPRLKNSWATQKKTSFREKQPGNLVLCLCDAKCSWNSADSCIVLVEMEADVLESFFQRARTPGLPNFLETPTHHGDTSGCVGSCQHSRPHHNSHFPRSLDSTNHGPHGEQFTTLLNMHKISVLPLYPQQYN